MGQFESFAEVLEKKIRREIEAEILTEVDAWLDEDASHNGPSSTRLDNSPDCLTALLGVVEPLRQSPQSKAHLYHRHRPAVRPQPKPRPPHIFNDAQKTAYRFFHIHGEEGLQQNFTLPELKSSFRRLALRLHPDRPQGSTEHFIRLKNAFDCLAAVF
jgi:hypothetical protein